MTTAAEPVYLCTETTEGDAGASCDDSVAFCRPGLYCASVQSGGEGECRALGEAGSTCGAVLGPGGCEAPLGCNTVTGRCEPPSEAGDACGDGRLCTAGLDCDDTSSECVAITWAGAGHHATPPPAAW
jgi:hypothetical protein